MGTQTVSTGTDTVLVKKPYWMKPGFTEKKHINEFYSKNRRQKVGAEKSGDREVMVKAIVKKVNDFHVKGFARIRDRLRADVMEELWYIFDVDPYRNG